MRYLHTMVRVKNLDETLDFFCNKLGMVETRRTESEKGRYTNLFLAASEDKASAEASKAPVLELTDNWDPEEYTGGRNFGHLAYCVDDIYAVCSRLQDGGVIINRPPRDGQRKRRSPGPRWKIPATGNPYQIQRLTRAL